MTEEERANMQAVAIREYWLAKGYRVDVHLAPVPFEKSRLYPLRAVRSNLVNGLPPGGGEHG